ncbi:DNA-directed RNA polymerase I subunit rpa2 [Chamberlinius hualienensis]
MFQDSVMSDAGGYMTTTQQSPSTGKKTARENTVTPVSIADIYKGLQNPEGFTICGASVNVVAFVGIINSVRVESTGIFYDFDDMSSKPMKVHQWTTDTEDSYNIKPLMENTYARVVGAARNNKGDVFVLAHNIIPLTDINELTTHLLEVIDAKLVLKKRLNEANTSVAAASSATNFNMDFSTSDNSMGGISGVQGKLKKNLLNSDVLARDLQIGYQD